MPSSKSNNVRIAFGNKLRALRLAAGLTQEDLGELASLDRTYISSAERGRRNVSLEAMHRLAGALRISPREFFDARSDAGAHSGERRK